MITDYVFKNISVWPQKSSTLPKKNDSTPCWPQHPFPYRMRRTLKVDFIEIAPFGNKIENKVVSDKIQQLFRWIHKEHNRAVLTLSPKEREVEIERFEQTGVEFEHKNNAEKM